MQARWGTHGDHATIAYAPSSMQECFELTIAAFNASERFRQPVIILGDEVVGHMREKIVIPDAGSYQVANRKRPTVNPDDFVPYKPDPVTIFRRWLPLRRISMARNWSHS